MAGDFIHKILKTLLGKASSQAPEQKVTMTQQMEALLPSAVSDRRIDVRFVVRTPCHYELVEGPDSRTALVRGKAYSLNISAEGILLLLDRKPEHRQLVAIHNPALQRQQTVPLFEVRWTTQLPAGASQERYLAGCHLTFGRFPYFLLQRNHLDQNISGLSL